MKSSNGTSSLGLSQIIQWDRWVVNPIEMKCPKIRNTLAWTVELERKGGNDNGGTGGISNHSYDYYHQPLQSEHSEQQQQHHESAPSRRSLVVATPRAGIVWQLNRSLAVKVVLSEQSQVSAQLSSNYGNNLRWYVVFYWGRLPPTEELLRLVLAVRPSSPFNCKAWEYNWKLVVIVVVLLLRPERIIPIFCTENHRRTPTASYHLKVLPQNQPWWNKVVVES
jgi:hypothetical protein